MSDEELPPGMLSDLRLAWAGSLRRARWRREIEILRYRLAMRIGGWLLREEQAELDVLKLEMAEAGAARCPSCDHLAEHHQSEGCWYSVTNGTEGRDLVCPCVAPVRCPTPCDDDCDAGCHEHHVVRWRRDHQPEDCPAVARQHPQDAMT